jgi:hypothetical protein
VSIDADAGDVAHRARQFEESLATESMSRRAEGERIIHLIPKRNVETWILNLNGHHVDEETDYSRHAGIDDLIVSAAQTLFEWTRPNGVIPSHCVPSLRLAIDELGRLE